MNASSMWARAELRARWRAWLLLGLLAGVTFGVAAAGVAGARRTEHAVPAMVAAAHLPDAAILANDLAFDAAARAQVAALPEVRAAYPFGVGVGAAVLSPPGAFADSGTLFPVTATTMRRLAGPLVAGRLPDPRRADEVVVDENGRDRYHLGLGATMVVGQTRQNLATLPPQLVPARDDLAFRQRMRVVGIAKSVSSETSWTASSGFYGKYGPRLVVLVNEFVDLRRGDADVVRLQADASRIAGHPVNVESSNDLFGIRKAKNVTGVERDGLLLFALAALLGGGVLVGQALVRAVTASATDLPTWRALGADRRTALAALLIPPALAAGVGAVAVVVVAVGLSRWFPLGTARRYDLDLGVHADWPVLLLGALAVGAALLAIAGSAAWWRVRRRDDDARDVSSVGRVVAPLAPWPALMTGARLALEPGRGRRAVPVRSALVGAVAGVLGVVACFTFRAGVVDATHVPERSGVVWDFAVAAGGTTIPKDRLEAFRDDRDVAGALHASWHRAVPLAGRSVPFFATSRVKGDVPFVVLSGRAPARTGEVAFAPTTMRELGLSVGDRVTVGTTGATARVVGEVLLPVTSHTDYDQSGWMTQAELTRVDPELADDEVEDYVLLRWAHGVDRDHARAGAARIAGSDLYPMPAQLPTAVADLGRISGLPLALAAFFGLLACATVAHALFTTVRRRRHDLAVVRAFGFTRRQSRLAIAWQATLLAAAGVVLGVPLGIVVGRGAWRLLAEDFPVLYVPPLAALAVVAVVPLTIAVANVLAAAPARSAARVAPAQALRTE